MLVNGIAIFFDWYHFIGVPVRELTLDYRYIWTGVERAHIDVVCKLVVFMFKSSCISLLLKFLLNLLELSNDLFFYLLAYLTFTGFTNVLIPEYKCVYIAFTYPAPFLQFRKLSPLSRPCSNIIFVTQISLIYELIFTFIRYSLKFAIFIILPADLEVSYPEAFFKLVFKE